MAKKDQTQAKKMDALIQNVQTHRKEDDVRGADTNVNFAINNSLLKSLVGSMESAAAASQLASDQAREDAIEEKKKKKGEGIKIGDTKLKKPQNIVEWAAAILGIVAGYLAASYNSVKLLVGGFHKPLKMLGDFIVKNSPKGGKLRTGIARIIKFQRAVARWIAGIVKAVRNFKLSSLIKVGPRLQKFLNGFTSVFARINKIVQPAIKFINKIFPLFGKISSGFKMFSTFGKVFSSFARVFGKIFLPVTIVMGIIDGIKGFIEGFSESEGESMLSKILDGIGGALGSIVAGLIGVPLDLLKKGVSWMLSKLGFENAATFLESFSFADMLKKIVSLPYTLLSKAVDWVVGIFKKKDPADAKPKGPSLAQRINEWMKKVIRPFLPTGKIDLWTKEGLVQRAIPNWVYEWAGVNKQTGAIMEATVSDTANRQAAVAGATAGATINAANNTNVSQSTTVNQTTYNAVSHPDKAWKDMSADEQFMMTGTT